jgi:hypothetical protein
VVYTGRDLEMAHHKRRRPKNRRAGCLLCKPWKVNGFNRRRRPDGQRFSDFRRQIAARRSHVLCELGPRVQSYTEF